MYPLYYLWFKGDKNNINTVMNFKTNVFDMNSEDIRLCYKRYNNLGSPRSTDAFIEDHKWLFERVDGNSKNLLDVGCGNRFLLDHIAQNTALSKLELFGLDISESPTLGTNIHYACGEIKSLPFKGKSFDIVTCFFVLEHIKNLNQAIKELKKSPVINYFSLCLVNGIINIHLIYMSIFFTPRRIFNPLLPWITANVH